MKRYSFVGVLVAAVTVVAGNSVADGNVNNGEKLFKGFLRCHACHSLEPDETKAGPTLAGLFGRRAGSLESYDEYSEAMVDSGVVWDDDTLSAFLADPQKYIPGNLMIRHGSHAKRVTSVIHRADLIAYLKAATMQ